MQYTALDATAKMSVQGSSPAGPALQPLAGNRRSSMHTWVLRACLREGELPGSSGKQLQRHGVVLRDMSHLLFCSVSAAAPSSHCASAAVQQPGSHRWPAVSRCKAMDAEREGRISLPMLAMLQQHLSLQIWTTLQPLPAANALHAANKSRDPPRSFVRASRSAGRHAAILAPHSTASVPPK